MLSSAPGFSSTVWTWAGNDVLRNSIRYLPGLRKIARSGGVTPCRIPSTKTSAQGRATILSVASRWDETGAVATVSDSCALGAASAGFAFAAWIAAPAFGAATASFTLRELLGSSALGGTFGSSTRGAGSPASPLAGSALGASPGVATKYTVFGAPSAFRWLRAITPVPTISVNASGAATSNLLLTASASGQPRRFTFGNLSGSRFGKRIACLGVGRGTVRCRLLGAGPIAYTSCSRTCLSVIAPW